MLMTLILILYTHACIYMLQPWMMDLQGIFGSAIVFALISVVAGMRGPLFVAASNPLQLVLVGISAGSMLLDEVLHLGK